MCGNGGNDHSLPGIDIIPGGLVTVGVIRHQLMHGHGNQMMGKFIVRRLSWKLHLDATQREQLRVIVHDGQQDMKALRHQIQPQIEEVFARSEAKIRVILRPDQQERLDKLIAERKARWAQSRDG